MTPPESDGDFLRRPDAEFEAILAQAADKLVFPPLDPAIATLLRH
jgi:hypothetical protein